jgi:hypothetical protein
MARKNETELIKCSKNRWLTAKAVKFENRCIHIIANQYGTSRYDPKIKPLKEKFTNIFEHLVFDKKLSLVEIKELIKNRKILIEK